MYTVVSFLWPHTLRLPYESLRSIAMFYSTRNRGGGTYADRFCLSTFCLYVADHGRSLERNGLHPFRLCRLDGKDGKSLTFAIARLIGGLFTKLHVKPIPISKAMHYVFIFLFPKIVGVTLIKSRAQL